MEDVKDKIIIIQLKTSKGAKAETMKNSIIEDLELSHKLDHYVVEQIVVELRKRTF